MEATERAMTSWDGAELFYRAWIPCEATDKAVLLFHRGHEHSGRWQETVDYSGLKTSPFSRGTRAGMGDRQANAAPRITLPT